MFESQVEAQLSHPRLDEEMKQVPSAAHAHLWAGGFCYLYLGGFGF